MKTKHQLLQICLLYAAMLPAVVQAQDYIYKINNGTISITKYTGKVSQWRPDIANGLSSGGAVTLPDRINGLPVTNIGDKAFEECVNLTSVAIGTNVTSIGECVFSLRKRPKGVTNTGDGAFSYCHSLTNVTIPHSVTTIGNWAFLECPRLTSVTIPDSVTNIGSCAFSGCRSLRNVTIPNSVTDIGDMAFGFCNSLTNIAIGNSVINIGDYAFFNCSNLTSITIPKSATNLGGLAFSGCTRLTAITVDSNNPAFSSVDGVLFNKNHITLIQFPMGKTGNYNIPNSAINIGDYAFAGCPNLTGITIPDSVTRLGYMVFANCTSLRAITVDRLNTSFSSLDGVLFDKSQTILVDYPNNKARNYTIPNGVAIIGTAAFAGCTNVTSVTIPDSVTRIGFHAFADCTCLTKIYFNGNAPNIDPDVFLNDINSTIYHLSGTTGWVVFGETQVFTNAPDATTNNFWRIRSVH